MSPPSKGIGWMEKSRQKKFEHGGPPGVISVFDMQLFVLFEIKFGTSLLYTMLKRCATHTYKGLNDFNPPWSLLLARYMQRSRGKS